MGRVVVKPYRVISGVGAGAGAALSMMIVMALLRFGFNFPTVPELMLNPIVKALGGEAFSAALDRLYYAGRPLLFTTILEGTLLLGALLGVLYAWLAKPNSETGRRAAIYDGPLGGIIYGLIIGLLLNIVFLPLIGQPVFADKPYGLFSDTPVPLWLGLLLLGLVFGVALNWLLPKPAVQEEQAVAISSNVGDETAAVARPRVVMESPESVDRRSFLRIAGGALAAVLGGVVFTFGGTVLNRGGLADPVTNTGAGAGSAGSGEVTVPTVAAGGSTGGQPVDSGSVVSGDTPVAVNEPPNIAVPTDTAVPAQPTDTPQPAQAEATATTGEVAQAEPPTATSQPPTATNPPATATSVPVPVINVQEITPVDTFYHVSKNFFDPSPSADGWKLEFKGMVDNPYSIDYKTLTSMPAVLVTTGMMCISNPIGGALAGNQVWKGVKLADLIKKAKPQAGVTKIAMRAVDDYSDSITYQKAMDPDVVLVWEMGGKPLTSQHGFPARLLVPGIYGMKHVKWITSVELVDNDFKGFWQDPSQGWSDPAPVNTMSRIDFPTDGTLNMGLQALSGVAFAGDRSISKVEVSTDGGKTWNQAYIKPPKSQTSWVVWGYNWTPTKPGKYVIQVRATDGKGNVQTSKRADPYPNGATGYHTVTYNVRG